MSRRVVIAEDEAIVRMDLRESLEEDGYEVVGETGRGDEIVDLVAATGPELAIVDIKMPGRDGLDAARDIRERFGVPVLVLTAFSQRSLVEEAREAGVLAYLVKPFQRHDLITAIELALSRHEEEQVIEGELAEVPLTPEGMEDKIETRRLIEKAKESLMEGYDLTEVEAFQFIRQCAMNSRSRMRDVAQGVLAGTAVPGGKVGGSEGTGGGGSGSGEEGGKDAP